MILRISIILVLLSGCRPVLKLTGNYKNPQPEDSLSIITFAQKESAKYNVLFIPGNAGAYKGFLDSVTSKCPYVLIFNKAAVNILTGQTCPWSNVKLLDSLDQLSGTARQDITVKKMLALLHPLDGAVTESAQYDYFIFYTWARFLPKLSSKMIRDVNRFTEKSRHRLFIGSINLDMQRSWDTAATSR